MKKNLSMVVVATVFLAAGMALMTSCSSNSSSPTGPSGIGQGKALYRGQVRDITGAPVEGAEIRVNGDPAFDSGGSPVVSGADGFFEVILLPGDTYNIDAWVECVPVECPDPPADPLCVPVECPDPAAPVWSDSVVVTPGNEIDPVEPEAVSNGIGECVSECVHLYKPGSSVPSGDLIPLEATKNGKFNATPCVKFCKENFRGVALPGDSSCNPFYLTYPVCDGGPDDPAPVDIAGADGPSNKPKKPKKPKSNNGRGNGNPSPGL